MKMIRNIKLLMAFLAIATLGITSCIEEGKDDIAGKGTNEFRLDANAVSVVTFQPDSAGQVTQLITIYRDAVSKSSISNEVTLTLDINSDSLVAYNTAHPTGTFVETDPAWYSLSIPEGIITFEPYEGAKTIEITLDTRSFNLSNRYAIPLVIKDASDSYSINKGHSFTMVQTLPINQYDGVYAYTGSLGRYDATTGAALGDGLDGTVVPDVYRALATTGASSVSVTPLWASGASSVGGIGVPIDIVVAGDNTITLVPLGGPAAANWGPIPGLDNKYDPNTKTFYINWKWGALVGGSPTGTTRAMMVVLTYEEPR
jgi:Domain of unknown function (DUF1735)